MNESGHKKELGMVERINRFIKQADVFGIPVSLTYKGENQIKSSIGGLATILSRSLVVAYFLYQCSGVIQRDYTLQSTITNINLSSDPYTFTLDQSNFDFGMYLQYIFSGSEPNVQANLDQYVDLMVSQNIYTWVYNTTTKANQFKKQKIRTTLGPCRDGRLGFG